MNLQHIHQSKKAAWMKMNLLLTAIALAFAVSTAILPYASETAHAEAYSTEVQLNLKPLHVQIGDQSMQVPGGLSAEGDSYVGLAFLSKQLGLSTSWDDSTQTVTVSSPTKTMKMNNKSTVYEMNGHHFYSDKAPIIIEGTTYLPLRFLLEQMGYNIGYRNADQLISIQPVKENPLTLSNVSEDHSQNEQKITVQYPQIESWEHTAARSKINAFIKEQALKYETSAQEQLKQLTKEQSADVPLRFSFDLNYTVTYNQQNKLSLYFDVYQYTGGAHGMYNRDAHTFDLSTGEELTLKQVTLNDANYIQIINDEINKQIKERDYVLLAPFETIQDDQQFYLKDNGVVVYFSLYEYTPYALGIPEFPIPLSRFKSE